MSQRKAYFPVADYDHTPDKLIKLGQIIHDLKSPDSALSAPLLPLPELDTTLKTDWEAERSRSLSGSMGLWGKFLAWILTLGGDVSVNFERKDADIFKFEKLETSFFVPSQKYVADAMGSESMKEWLGKNPKTGSLFMITGVKIARGAAITRQKVRGVGGEGEVSLNLMPITSVPAEGGPMASLNKEVVESEGFKTSSDFVFAYRLKKITIQRKTGNVSSKDWIKGATLSVEVERGREGSDSESESDEGKEDAGGKETHPLVFDIFSDEKDFGLDFVPSGCETPEVMDDEDDCLVVFKPVAKSVVQKVA